MEKPSVEFRTMEFGPARLIGRKTTVRRGGTAAAFVRALREDGSSALLQALPGRLSPEGDIAIWMGEYDRHTDTFTEIPGVLAAPDVQAPPGFEARELPRCVMGVAAITGPTRDLARGAHNKLVKLMARNGWTPDYAPGFSMEYYSREAYERDGERYTFGYLLPCRRAQP